MKKTLFLFAIIFYSTSFAQRGTASIKLGQFFPSASGSGFIIGYEGGRLIDQGLDFGWSIDWFHETYVDKKLVAEFNDYYGISGGEINELRARTSLHDFPLMGVVTAKMLVAPYTKIFFTGGIGAEVLLINYRNFQAPDKDEFQAAFDFNWRLGIGALYQIGNRSDIFGEITYHNSAPSWQYEVTDPQTRITKTFEREFDMSGLMFRLGIKFYY